MAVDDVVAKVQQAWHADRKAIQDFIEDKIGKNLKLLSGGNQDRF